MSAFALLRLNPRKELSGRGIELELIESLPKLSSKSVLEEIALEEEESASFNICSFDLSLNLDLSDCLLNQKFLDQNIFENIQQ